MSMKNSNDTIGNRTRDLQGCSALAQPTASPRAPLLMLIWKIHPAVMQAGVKMTLRTKTEFIELCLSQILKQIRIWMN